MNRKKWLAERRSGIGGSDIAAIVGADPRRGPLDVFLDKIGEAPEVEDNDEFERGRMLEPIIARKYRKVTGRKLTKVKGLLRDPDAPFILGTPDYLFSHVTKADGYEIVTERCPLEIKSMRVAIFMAAKRDGLSAKYVTQEQWYLQKGLCDRPWGAYAAFSMEYWALIHFDIEANPGLQHELRQAGTQFMQDHVLPKKPPSSDGWGVSVDVVKGASEVLDLPETPELRAAIRSYDEARDLAKTGEDLKKDARQQVIDALAGRYGAFRVGEAILHLRQTQRMNFDKKALTAARPLDPQKVANVIAKQFSTDDFGTALIDTLKNDCTLDLNDFTKPGKASETLNVYLRGDTPEGEG